MSEQLNIETLRQKFKEAQERDESWVKYVSILPKLLKRIKYDVQTGTYKIIHERREKETLTK